MFFHFNRLSLPYSLDTQNLISRGRTLFELVWLFKKRDLKRKASIPCCTNPREALSPEATDGTAFLRDCTFLSSSFALALSLLTCDSAASALSLASFSSCCCFLYLERYWLACASCQMKSTECEGTAAPKWRSLLWNNRLETRRGNKPSVNQMCRLGLRHTS